MAQNLHIPCMITIENDVETTISLDKLEDKLKDQYMLSLSVNTNRMGILYSISAAMYMRKWNIVKAEARTIEGKGIVDTFIIEPLGIGFAKQIKARALMSDLNKLIRGDLTVVEYTSQKLFTLQKSAQFNKHTKKIIQITKQPNTRYWEISLETSDRPGLLFHITKALYLTYFDIITLDSYSRKGRAFDKLIVSREAGKETKNDDYILRESLSKII